MDKEEDCEICLKERLEKRVMGLRKDSDLMGLETQLLEFLNFLDNTGEGLKLAEFRAISAESEDTVRSS